MTQAVNEKIHKCPACGTLRYEIDYASPDSATVIFITLGVAACLLYLMMSKTAPPLPS